MPERKRHQKTYYETDLDSCVTSNLALSSRPSSLYNMSGVSEWNWVPGMGGRHNATEGSDVLTFWSFSDCFCIDETMYAMWHVACLLVATHGNFWEPWFM